jgi:hypothetical protein
LKAQTSGSSEILHPLLQKLEGGDLRSIGRANDVASEVIAEPKLFAVLVAGLSSNQPAVRMRCADAAEKASLKLPGALQPYAAHILRLLESEQPKEMLWHLLQMVPRVKWSTKQLPALLALIEPCLTSSSSIVQTCALQARVELLAQTRTDKEKVAGLLRRLQRRSGFAAVRSRARKLLATL